MNLDGPALPSNPKPRRILPAPGGTQHSRSPSPPASSSACEFCRRRKQKCNRGRPRCSTCVSRNVLCEYQTTPSETHTQALKRKYAIAEQERDLYVKFVEFLKTKDGHEVAEIMRRLRGGDSIESILRQIEDGDLLLQLSLLPDTRRLFELPYNHSIPDFLLTPTNPYLTSPIFTRAFRTRGRHMVGNVSPEATLAQAQRVPSIYATPYHAAKLVEPILDGSRPSLWTNVTDDDELCEKLIGTYILTQYPFYPLFQKDRFLRDLKDGHPRYCSPLLVNAILAGACRGMRATQNDKGERERSRNLGNQFMAEARRLWEHEDHETFGNIDPRMTRIQTAMIIFLCLYMDGEDDIGFIYMEQAGVLAREMQLGKITLDQVQSEMGRVQLFTAWTFYGWQALLSFQFHRSPLVEEPPDLELPDVVSDPHFYGEVWLQYPRENPIPSNFGHTFYHVTKMRSMLNELSLASVALNKSSPSHNVDTALTYSFYLRLQEWHNCLPESLKPQKVVLPCQLKVHIHFNYVVVRIMQPTTALATTGVYAHDIESGRLSSRIVTSARINLETTVRLYYLCHGPDEFDPLMTPLYTALGFYGLHDLRSAVTRRPRRDNELSDIRSTLILTIKGLYGQGRHSFLPLALSLLLRDLVMEIDTDIVEVMKHFPEISDPVDGTETEQQATKIRKKLIEGTSSQWPVIASGIMDAFQGRRLRNFAKPVLK